MDDGYLIELNVCNFKGVQTEAIYTCFNNELCCDEGCCPKTTFNIFRIWYFWLTIIGLLFVFSGGCKICKFASNRQARVSSTTRRSRNAARFSRQTTSTGMPSISYDQRSLEMYFANPRRNELDELINLRRLLVEQEACNVAIDRYVACQSVRTREQVNSVEPPSYNSLQIKTTQFNAGDPPPNYSSVCKNLRQETGVQNNNIALNAPILNMPEMAGIHAQASAPHTQNEGNNINNN